MLSYVGELRKVVHIIHFLHTWPKSRLDMTMCQVWNTSGGPIAQYEILRFSIAIEGGEGVDRYIRFLYFLKIYFKYSLIQILRCVKFELYRWLNIGLKGTRGMYRSMPISKLDMGLEKILHNRLMDMAWSTPNFLKFR